MINLKGVIDLYDEINIYDNTEMFRERVDFKNSKIIWGESEILIWIIELLEN